MITRRILTLVLAGLLAASAGVPAGTARAGERTWQVASGADSADHAVQLLDFFPRTITINVGDAVTWTNEAADHTVTFLSGAKPPLPDIRQPDGRVLFNPLVAFPQGGPTYDGTGIASSGLLQGPGKTWTLRFTKPGRYTYVCLLHPAMVGTVVVRPADQPVAATQAEYDRQAAQQREAELAAGKNLLEATRPAKQGTVYTLRMVGNPKERVALYRFGADVVRVHVGDTVRWVMDDPDEIHTVTFPGSGQVPPFIVPTPQPQGPPKLYENPRAVAPAGGPVHRGTGYYNSGILVPAPLPGPHTYELRFTKRGTFTYWCVVHVPEGMRGTVIVQ
jgi:plastocyanin